MLRGMMRPRTILAGSALLAGSLAGYALFSAGGLSRMQHLRAEAETLRQDVATMQAQNEQLRDEVKRLQGETPGADAYLEGVIRAELGYIKSDEHLLLLPAARTNGGASTADR